MKFNDIDLEKLYPPEHAQCHLCHARCTIKYRKPGNFIDLPQPDPMTDYYHGITRNPNEYLPRGTSLVKDYCDDCVKKYYPQWITKE